jgi:hypothetical protein
MINDVFHIYTGAKKWKATIGTISHKILNIVPKIKWPQIKAYPIRIRTFDLADIVTDASLDLTCA